MNFVKWQIYFIVFLEPWLDLPRGILRYLWKECVLCFAAAELIIIIIFIYSIDPHG
jgi:hypothetical protein